MPAHATRLIAGAVLLACAAFAAWELLPILRRLQGDFLAVNDFFAQWSFARFAHDGDPAALYDPDALHRFQLGLEPRLRQSFPFAYPPTYLFAIWPLGSMPFVAAQFVWDAATLLLFGWAVLGRRLELPLLALLMVAPATIMSLAYGQNGLLVSALIVAGMRLTADRPLLGGALLGLATIKPQLGLLLPFALIAAREWRAIAAAALSAAALALLAGWAFGPAIWPAWLDAALGHAAWVEASVSDYRKPTVMATLSLFGADSATAQAGQVFVSVVVIAVVVLCCSRGMDDLSAAAVQSGTFLAVPFAFVYDLPMVVNAVVLYVREHRRSGRRWGLVETGILSFGVLFPALTTLTTRFFTMNSVALLLLFGLIALRSLQTKTPRLKGPGRVADLADQAE